MTHWDRLAPAQPDRFCRHSASHKGIVLNILRIEAGKQLFARASTDAFCILLFLLDEQC